MPIAVQCSGCGRRFRAPDELLGKRVNCPKCSALIDVRLAEQHQPPPLKPAPQRMTALVQPPIVPTKAVATPKKAIVSSGPETSRGETRSDLTRKWLESLASAPKCVGSTLELKAYLLQAQGGPKVIRADAGARLVLGAVILLATLILGFFIADSSRTVAPGNIIVGMLFFAGLPLFLSGLFSLVGTYLRPTIQSACPRCGKINAAFLTGPLRLCSHCLLATVVERPGRKRAFALLRCPNCSCDFAAAEGSTTKTCPSCNAELLIDGACPKAQQNAKSCPYCHAKLAKGSSYCVQCCRTLASLDLQYVTDGYVPREHVLAFRRAAYNKKDGLLRRACVSPAIHLARVKKVLAVLNSDPSETNVSWIALASGADRLGLIAFAIEEIEAACNKHAPADGVKHLLIELCRSYACTLKAYYSDLSLELNRSGKTPLLLAADSVDTEWTTAWNHTLDLLAKSAQLNAGCLPRMRSDLFEVELREFVKPPNKEIGSLEPNVAMFQLVSCKELLDEAGRLEQTLESIRER